MKVTFLWVKKEQATVNRLVASSSLARGAIIQSGNIRLSRKALEKSRAFSFVVQRKRLNVPRACVPAQGSEATMTRGVKRRLDARWRKGVDRKMSGGSTIK